ncbi:ATP-dependent DNA/RNA helicase [Savitreella phatthalungensis]
MIADESATQTSASFDDFALDARLLRAISTLRFKTPTPVQAEAIPLILSGKDVLARAKTGSGKTAAYLIPVVQKLLTRSEKPDTTAALLLVPTKELSEQVTKTAGRFAAHTGGLVSVLNLNAAGVSDDMARTALSENPSIVVATPARALMHVNRGSLILSDLQVLVVDEADLVSSYGHADDLMTLANSLPRGLQTVMMSATLDASVDSLKDRLTRDPVILRLTESEDAKAEGQLMQYHLSAGEDDKFLYAYIILKLRLVGRRVIVFVNELDRSYRLKLFLEQFAVKSCVLNHELPVASRQHILDEFNKGVYDIVIASDESEILGPEDLDHQTSDTESPIPPTKKRKRPTTSTTTRKTDREFGAARGVDFRNVNCVLNFDLPRSVTSYVHRIGRTARAGRSGVALSFVVPRSKFGKLRKAGLSVSGSDRDERVLSLISADQESRGNAVTAYAFDRSSTDAFAYRCNDALRSVTSTRVREARAKEIRRQLLASDTLRDGFFADNAAKLDQLIKHDTEALPDRILPHLKNVPDYLLPANHANSATGGEGQPGTQTNKVGFVPFAKQGPGNRIRNARNRNRTRGGGSKKESGRGGRRNKDPLKSFK